MPHEEVDFIECDNCGTPCYVFEMDENYKLTSALCTTCANDEIGKFRIPGMEGIEIDD